MEKLYKILLDTNFILIHHKFNIDIISEIERVLPGKYELLTLSSVIDELKKLKSIGRFGLAFIEQNNIKVIDWPEKGDKGLLSYAEKHGCILATNDKELRKKARMKHIPVLFMRKKRILDCEGVE
jgi:rRNA-processing protein FCF1